MIGVPEEVERKNWGETLFENDPQFSKPDENCQSTESVAQ